MYEIDEEHLLECDMQQPVSDEKGIKREEVSVKGGGTCRFYFACVFTSDSTQLTHLLFLYKVENSMLGVLPSSGSQWP